MKRIISFGSVLLLVMVLIGTNVFGADYFLYDKETNKILFMGKNDSEFSEKINMEKNPDYMMATDNPDIYLAIFAPENVQKTKKKDQPEPQKGQLIIFDVTTGRTEDLVELGYAPYQWVYSKDRRQFFISYKPAPDSEFLELLHYNIPDKTSAKLENIAKEVSQLILSNDDSNLYTLVPSNKKRSETGQILVLNTSPLSIKHTIPTNNNPHSFFSIGSDKLAIIDVDIKNRKGSGMLRLINSSDYSPIEEKEFLSPFRIDNIWNPDSNTLITIASRYKKNYVFKSTPDDVIVNEIDSLLLDYTYNVEKNCLYLLTSKDFQILNYNNNQLTVCETDTNQYDNNYYKINLIPNSDIAALYCPAGGKLKLVDLDDNSLLAKVSYGRSGKKFRNFMSNLAVSLVLSAVTSYPYGGYYYTVYTVDLFRGGVNVALENSKYFVLRASTKDITVFDNSFESPAYLVPPERPLIMFQINQPSPQVLLVTEKEVCQIISEDLTLKPIITFNKEAKGCLLLEEENRFVMMTDQELLVIDSANFEVKNRFELFGNPDQEYSRIKEDEQRFYFIPTL